jgi:hypothetical protein
MNRCSVMMGEGHMTTDATVRLPKQLLSWADEVAGELTRYHPQFAQKKLSKAEVIHLAVQRGLDALEREARPRRGAGAAAAAAAASASTPPTHLCSQCGKTSAPAAVASKTTP